jgi:hypothetical protein
MRSGNVTGENGRMQRMCSSTFPYFLHSVPWRLRTMKARPFSNTILTNLQPESTGIAGPSRWLADSRHSKVAHTCAVAPAVSPGASSRSFAAAPHCRAVLAR